MKEMKRWNAVAGLASLMLLLAVVPAEPQLAEDRSGLERLLRRAVNAANTENFAEALELYQQLEQSSDPWYAWAGTSGRVMVHRMAGEGDSARAVTQRIAVDRAELAGLMEIWDGDTAFLEGDFGRALGAYRQAADLHGRQVVDGNPIGVTALRQLSRAQLEKGDALTAAETERELLRSYPGFVDREHAVARILALEAMASGELPLKPLERLLHDGDCSPKHPCVLGRGAVRRDVPADALPLAGLGGLYFLNEPSIAETLKTEENMAFDTLAATSTATACTTPWAYSGFTKPMRTNTSTGYKFMETPDCCGGYHTGIDLNRGGYQEDCNDPFYNTADGCVRNVMSSTSDWGSATVASFYPPRTWTSQYGHAYEVYVSVGQAISKGALMGRVGDIGTGACHLHFEIREHDHTARNNATAYHNTPKKRVGDEYQNPLPFIKAHKGFQKIRWRDENHFTVIGDWTSVSGIGDEDDMKWAYTTPTDSKTTYARRDIIAPKSGSWELWAFIPYANRSSEKVPYTLRRRPDGKLMFKKVVKQKGRNDAWVKIGSAWLTADTKYRIKVATNTGESKKKVALDDFLLIKPSDTALPDLKVTGITFAPAPSDGVKTKVSAHISNVGWRVSGEFKVKWFLDNVLVASGTHESLVPGEASTSATRRFDWTPTLGKHTLQFVVDVDGEVTEANEINNSARVTVNVKNPPDLKVSGITFTSTPKVGVRTTAVADLANVGETPTGKFNVGWYLNGVQVGYGMHESLAPGEVSNGNVRLEWIPTPGKHKLRFVADVEGYVAESNESNNHKQIEVDAGADVDLVVSSITFSPSPKVGQTTTITAHLANVGSDGSAAFNCKWFQDGNEKGYFGHPSLPAGGSSSPSIEWTPTHVANFVWRFEADVDGHVAETNESNNFKEVTVYAACAPGDYCPEGVISAPPGGAK